MNSSIDNLIEMINQTNGIPLVVTTINQTDPLQFYLSLIIGSIFIFFFLFTAFKERITHYIGVMFLMYHVYFRTKKNTIIIKHTNLELFSASMIDRKTRTLVEKALIKFKGEPFDLILYTPGGEVFSAVYISRMLRQYKGKIRSIIPIYSMSGGTLLALSTDEIYMNDYSTLGAIDPQLSSFLDYGSARAWKEVVKIKGKNSEDLSIRMKLMGEQYTKSIKINIRDLLKSKVSRKELTPLVNFLVDGKIEHGYNITKDVLKEFGMDIKDISQKDNIKLIKLLHRVPEGITYAKYKKKT